MRDAFGRLIVDPGTLDRLGRVECLRRLSGELQAADTREARWLGGCLLRWLSGDATSLEAALRIKPERGSHSTAQALTTRDAQDRALLRLAAAIGSDAEAVRVMRDEVPCSPPHAALLADVRALNCPCSRAAFTRARRRASRHAR